MSIGSWYVLVTDRHTNKRTLTLEKQYCMVLYITRGNKIIPSDKTSVNYRVIFTVIGKCANVSQ